MNRYRTVPTVNASLLHELRMITEQLFQRRPKVHSTGLRCSFCITVLKTKPQDAITVINGQAACHDHMYYCQGGEYTQILKRIQGDVNRNTAGAAAR